MIDLVCGLSKSGKTTLIRSLNLHLFGIRHVRASALLTSRARPTIGLSAADVAENQRVLVNNLLAEIANHSHLVLDGHLLLETTDGPQLVPKNYLNPLPIVGVTFISADPLTLGNRRRIERIAESPKYLSHLAKIEEEYARLFAEYRNIPFTLVDSDDAPNFLASIRSHLQI